MSNITIPAGQILKAADAQQVFDTLVSEIRSWVRVVNEEKTKQTLIKAEAKVRIAAIKDESTLLIGYLDRSFDERRVLFEQHFEILRQALSAGSTDQVAAILGAITALAVKSPFQDLKDIAVIRETWASQDKVIEI